VSSKKLVPTTPTKQQLHSLTHLELV